MVVRCTRRMLALLGRAVAVTDPPPCVDDWYANLLWLDRRKCVLFTHGGTLFSIVVPDVRSAELRPLGHYVTAIVERELRAEGLPADALGPLAPDDVRIAKTASRSVLGFMNDMAFQIDYAVAAAGGLDRCDFEAINRHLRRIPYNRGDYVYAIDLATARGVPAPASRRGRACRRRSGSTRLS